jgi:hypothetical protein
MPPPSALAAAPSSLWLKSSRTRWRTLCRKRRTNSSSAPPPPRRLGAFPLHHHRPPPPPPLSPHPYPHRHLPSSRSRPRAAAPTPSPCSPPPSAASTASSRSVTSSSNPSPASPAPHATTPRDVPRTPGGAAATATRRRSRRTSCCRATRLGCAPRCLAASALYPASRLCSAASRRRGRQGLIRTGARSWGGGWWGRGTGSVRPSWRPC